MQILGIWLMLDLIELIIGLGNLKGFFNSNDSMIACSFGQ